MKSHLMQTSVACAALAISSLVFAQLPTQPAASAAVPQAGGPNSAFANVVGQPGDSKAIGAAVPAPQSETLTTAAKVVAMAPAPQVVPASNGKIPATVSTVNPKAKELEALQAEIPLWKAKAEIAKYRAEVAKAEQSMGGALGAPLPVSGPGQTIQGPMPSANPVRPAPSVERTESDGMRLVTLRAFDGRFDALVDFGGNVVTVRAGDSIGPWTVASIDSAGVKLTSGKRVRRLGL